MVNWFSSLFFGSGQIKTYKFVIQVLSDAHRRDVEVIRDLQARILILERGTN